MVMIPIIRAPFHSPTSSLLKANEIEEVGVGGELILKKKKLSGKLSYTYAILRLHGNEKGSVK